MPRWFNGTCIGLYPNVDEIPAVQYETVQPGMVAADVVFNDPNTRFLAACAAQGAKTINGLGMLANQAAVNFKLWTGEDAPDGLMLTVLEKEFGLK